MQSHIFKPWSLYSVRPESMPLTSRSLTTGEAWSEAQWIKFLERYQRPLNWYAQRTLKANAQEAEEAFRDMVYEILKRPELMREKPGVRFRAIVRRSFRNRLYKLFRARNNWLGVLRCFFDRAQMQLTRNGDEKRYRDQCLYAVKMNFVKGNDQEESARFGITEYDRMVWQSVRYEHVPQVEVAARLGKTKSSVCKTVEKVDGYHELLLRSYLED